MIGVVLVRKKGECRIGRPTANASLQTRAQPLPNKEVQASIRCSVNAVMALSVPGSISDPLLDSACHIPRQQSPCQPQTMAPVSHGPLKVREQVTVDHASGWKVALVQSRPISRRRLPPWASCARGRRSRTQPPVRRRGKEFDQLLVPLDRRAAVAGEPQEFGPAYKGVELFEDRLERTISERATGTLWNSSSASRAAATSSETSASANRRFALAHAADIVGAQSTRCLTHRQPVHRCDDVACVPDGPGSIVLTTVDRPGTPPPARSPRGAAGPRALESG